MRNLTTLVAASLTTAALLCSTAASAQQVHASGTGAGNWIWARATTTSGQRLCVAAKMAGSRTFRIKHYEGDHYLTIEMAKDGWTIPKGTRMRVAVAFDAAAPWTAPQAAGEDDTVGFTIGAKEETRQDILTFTEQFRQAGVVQIHFRDGTEPLWSISMSGSGRAIGEFDQCLVAWTLPRTTESKPAPTQPFGSSTPTQPFGAGAGGGAGPARRS
jgi:hypothetical protein